MIDVMEPSETAAGWAARVKFTLPVLLDADGKVAETYAPLGVLPDLPRNQVPIASNLIIDRSGTIRFFSLLDSTNFDARLVALRAKLDELLAAEPLEPAKPPVVTARAESVEIAAGGLAAARVVATIAAGYHVQANPASDPYLIPVRLDLPESPGLHSGSPVYPPSQRYRIQGATGDLLTYEGTIEIRVPLEASKDALPGERSLWGTLRYQACDARVCLRPNSVEVELPVRVRSRLVERPSR